MGMTWALFALTQEPTIQEKLRKELLAFPSDKPTMDELNALPYLDAVIREILRLHPPVPSTLRAATKDDIIPLAEKIKDRNGQWIDHIEYAASWSNRRILTTFKGSQGPDTVPSNCYAQQTQVPLGKRRT